MPLLIEHPSGPLNLLPPFPEKWDSSMRSAFVACPRQWYYSYLLGLRKSLSSIHLHFGGCIAKGLEVTRLAYWADGLDEINAVSEGIKALIHAWGDFSAPEYTSTSRASVKDLSGCIDALYSYFETFPLGSDQISPVILEGVPLIEKSFAVPVPGTKHPVTGEPIIYCGRFDMLGHHNDAIFVVDEKTTTSLGPSWQANWNLRGQLTGYCWGAKSFGLEPAGVIVRGIGVLKQTINFQQVILSRPDWMIQRWLDQLSRDINRAADLWCAARDRSEERPQDAFDQAFDSACSSYGGCGYLSLCDTPDPVNYYENYEISHWDPLRRVSDE